jgi:hypothetical protein
MKVEGGSENDRAFARSAFSGLIGATPTREAVRAAIDAVYSSGRFDLVKIDLAPAAGGTAELLVYLTPTAKPGNSILVNYDLNAIVSTTSSVYSGLSAGLMFRALTTKDSAFFANASLTTGFSGYAEFFQPIGPFFLMPWARYVLESDEYAFSESSISISTIYRHYGGGLWAGVALGKHTDFRFGGSFEILKDGSRNFPTPIDERLSVLRAAFRTDTRSSTVFPENGVSLLAYGSWGDPAILSQISFAQAELDFEAALPLGPRMTLGLAAFAGTDFSSFIPGAPIADDSRYFTLARQGMFYGLNSTELQALGNTALGLGLELRRKMGQINPILGGDLFLMANASIGATDQTALPSTVSFFPLRYSATIGGGVRLTGEFGVMGSVGIIGISNAIRPALSVMIGSFEDRLEDRR